MASTTSLLGSKANISASEASEFYTSFNRKVVDLEVSIRSASRPEELHTVLQTFSALRNELTQATNQGFLPAHDRGLHEKRLEKTQELLNQRRRDVAEADDGASGQVKQPSTTSSSSSGAAPTKSKFAFKRRTKPDNTLAAASAAPPEAANTSLTKVDQDPSSTANESPTTTLQATTDRPHIAISNLRLKFHRWGAPFSTSINASTSSSSSTSSQLEPSVDIRDIDSCILDLRQIHSHSVVLRSVQIRNIQRSIVLLPRVAGSVMVHGLSSCLLEVPSCHQFRIHDSTNSTIHLSTKGSIVTMESCKSLRFLAHGETELRIQDFDDLINSVQLKEPGTNQKQAKAEANFELRNADNTTTPSSGASIVDGAMDNLVQDDHLDQDVFSRLLTSCLPSPPT